MTENTSFRNVTALPGDRFDCEIEHPQFGWLPFTADPNDPEPQCRAIWQAIKDAQPKG